MDISRHRPGSAFRHRIAVLALDRVLPMEAGMPFHVFDRPTLPYEVVLCGRSAGPIDTAHGWTIMATGGLDVLPMADTVIVPAYRGHLDGVPDDVADALRAAHGNGARIASICTGAFALASAGLLDGRRATTHWASAQELALRHPRVDVDPDVLYVDEGDVLTSAGVASGIDLCLHLVQSDHGSAVANAVARQLVAAPRRNGGQAQFIERQATPSGRSRIAPTLDWALARLDEPLTVPQLAANARLSTRTFARSFASETGMTPLQWLNTARVDRARELLETGDAGVDRIAEACGLGTAANLRRHFHRVTGLTPSEYRRSFAPAR